MKGEDGCRTFSVRIREDIVSRMDLIAAQTGRSRNELVGIFLEYALDHCEIEEAPAMNRDYRDYPASIWDAIGDVDQGICCAALGGVVWDL